MLSLLVAAAIVTSSPAWAFLREGNELTLFYGVPGTDAVGFRMRCRAASGQITLSYLASPDAAPTMKWGDRRTFPMVLSSEKAVSRRRGVAAGEDLGIVVSALTSVSDPALASFQSSGRLSVDGARVNTRADTELRNVQRFFKGCHP